MTILELVSLSIYASFFFSTSILRYHFKNYFIKGDNHRAEVS